MLGRYSSEIRTGCANERPSGSVRGAPGNWCPYRDQQLAKAQHSRLQYAVTAVTDTAELQAENSRVSLSPPRRARPATGCNTP